MQLFPGRTAYLLVLGIALVDAVWIGVSSVSLPIRQLAMPAANATVLGLLALAAARRSFADRGREELLLRFGYLLQGLLFLQLSWIALRVFNHVSMSSALPYADQLLSSWDTLLPIDWHAYFAFVQSNPILAWALDGSYTSLSLFSFAAFVALALVGDLKRTRFFLETFLIVAVICTTVGMFFPAKAAVATYFGDVSSIANFDGVPGVYHLHHLERLRSGEAFALDIHDLPGLVTFPSFHTAAGIVLVVCSWRTVIFPLAAAYSALMIASTPIFGGHYFVDLIGGAAVAGIVLYLFASRPHYAGIFERRDRARRMSGLEPRRLPASG